MFPFINCCCYTYILSCLGAMHLCSRRRDRPTVIGQFTDRHTRAIIHTHMPKLARKSKDSFYPMTRREEFNLSARGRPIFAAIIKTAAAAAQKAGSQLADGQLLSSWLGRKTRARKKALVDCFPSFSPIISPVKRQLNSYTVAALLYVELYMFY